MIKRLAIIGSGDLGELIAYHAINDNHYSVVGFFDDFAEVGTMKNEIPVLGTISDVMNSFDDGLFDFLMIGIGYKHMLKRKEVFLKFNETIPFGSVIHSSSFVDQSVQLGEGIFILPGCILDKSVKIGNNVLLNTGVVISHDSEIKDHCFLSPAVKIAGKSIINECCILGINSTIIDNIRIEQNIQIGGATLVIKNLYDPGLYVGVPAEFKK